MAIQLGEYIIATHMQRKRTVPVPADMQAIEQGLDGFAKAFHKSLDYILVGGSVGQFLNLGHFPKMVSDIDIEVNAEDIPRLIQDLEGSGYALAERVFLSSISAKKFGSTHAIIAKKAQHKPFETMHKPKIYRITSSISMKSFAEYVDLYIQVLDGNERVNINKGIRIVPPSPHPIQYHSTKSGLIIRTPCDEHLAHFRNFYYSPQELESFAMYNY